MLICEILFDMFCASISCFNSCFCVVDGLVMNLLVGVDINLNAILDDRSMSDLLSMPYFKF